MMFVGCIGDRRNALDIGALACLFQDRQQSYGQKLVTGMTG
jgi:hypothetical protein